MKKNVVHSFDLAHAYLEMARAHLGVPVRAPQGTSPEDRRMTNTTLFALVAHGYIFSFMAINAFVSICLWDIWDRPNSPLQAKYPKAKGFKHLLKTDLRELKDSINELCAHYNLEPLHKSNPEVWNGLLQIVKATRDFMTHPTPDAVEFNKIVGDAVQKHTWGKPAHIVEQTMIHFFDKQGLASPEWIKKNTDFQIEAIRALATQPTIEDE